MKMLEVLSLANCKLLDLPQEIGELTNIRLLDLEDCQHSRQKFNAIFLNVISRWSRLEELYSSSFMKYTREHIAELKSLSHLTTLIMEVPDLGCIPEGFSFPELEVFKIAICGSVHHKQSNYLEVCGWVNAKKFFASPSLGCVKPLLKRTQYLKLSSFEGLRTIFPHQLADRDGLAGLKTLEISDCADLEYLIDSEEWKLPPVIEHHQHTCLMHLEKLDLQCLGSFKGLCHGVLPAELSMSLQKLKSLGFFKCEKLINVFASLELMQRFDGLEELSVDSCGALKYVFNLKIEKPAFEEKKMLSHLRELALCDLPAMKCIWDGPTRLLRLDNLQIADIQNCNKLKVGIRSSTGSRIQEWGFRATYSALPSLMTRKERILFKQTKISTTATTSNPRNTANATSRRLFLSTSNEIQGAICEVPKSIRTNL
ncbi:disease resistance NBS-LRR family protein [Salix suchowensis]|nr:disease resistance NBS-LRR family protein [Salix suchowensis]